MLALDDGTRKRKDVHAWTIHTHTDHKGSKSRENNNTHSWNSVTLAKRDCSRK